MAQADYQIADQPGASFLSELNAQLLAIVTQNSGPTAPATTYAGQMWWDTTANLLKIRNAANTAWVTVASWDGTTYIPYRAGTAIGTAATKNTGTSGDAVPLLNAANTWSAAQTFGAGATVTGDFLGTPNSGSFRTWGMPSGSNTTLVLQGGATSGIGGNIELRNSGDNNYDATNHRFRSVDGATTSLTINSIGNVGVGTPNPKNRLVSVANIGDANASNLGLAASGSAQGQRTGMSFYPTFEGTTDNTPRRAADILAGFNGGSWGKQYLSFHVGSANNDDGNLTPECMRITAAGNVGIGTTTPAAKLQVNGAIMAKSGQPSAFNANQVGYTFDGEIDGGMFSPDDGVVVLAANGVERVRIAPNGNVGIWTSIPSTSLHANGPIRYASYTVATLPSASAVGAGTRAWVTDANVNYSYENIGSVVAGGGFNFVSVYSDGSNWRIG